MKKYITILLLFMIAFFFTGCETFEPSMTREEAVKYAKENPDKFPQPFVIDEKSGNTIKNPVFEEKIEALDVAGDAAGMLGLPFASIIGEIASLLLGGGLLISNAQSRNRKQTLKNVVTNLSDKQRHDARKQMRKKQRRELSDVESELEGRD